MAPIEIFSSDGKNRDWLRQSCDRIGMWLWQTWFFWWLLGNLGQQHTLITKRVLPVDCRSISPFFPTYLLQMCREMEAYLGKFRQHLWHCSQEAAMLSRPVKPTDYNNKVHAPPGLSFRLSIILLFFLLNFLINTIGSRFCVVCLRTNLYRISIFLFVFPLITNLFIAASNLNFHLFIFFLSWKLSF